MNNQILLKSKKIFKKFSPTLISISIGLLVGFIMMFIISPANSFLGFYYIIIGGFKGGFINFLDSVDLAVPIMLTGISVAFAMKSGLFNIGASGQMMMGALFAVLFALKVGFAGRWVFAIIVGMLGGGLWALIVGLLKAYRNVNEVVASIMLNYIALYMFRYIPKVTDIRSSLNVSFINSVVTSGDGGTLPVLEFISNNFDISLFIAIFVAVLINFIIKKTTLGFELTATGFSISGTEYAGMNSKRNIVVAMFISGMIAGLAGALLALTSQKLEIPSGIWSEGFDGIYVALIGANNPIGIIFASVFVEHIKTGASSLSGIISNNVTLYSPKIADLIISVIVYSIAITAAFQMLIQYLKKRKMQKQLKEEN